MSAAGKEPDQDANAPIHISFPQDWQFFLENFERLSQKIPRVAYTNALRTTKCPTTAVLLAAMATIDSTTHPGELFNTLDAEIRSHRTSQDLHLSHFERNILFEQKSKFADQMLTLANQDRDEKQTQIHDLSRQLDMADDDKKELQAQIRDLKLTLSAKGTRIEIDRRQMYEMHTSIQQLKRQLSQQQGASLAKHVIITDLKEQAAERASESEAMGTELKQQLEIAEQEIKALRKLVQDYPYAGDSETT